MENKPNKTIHSSKTKEGQRIYRFSEMAEVYPTKYARNTTKSQLLKSNSKSYEFEGKEFILTFGISERYFESRKMLGQ